MNKNPTAGSSSSILTKEDEELLDARQIISPITEGSVETYSYAPPKFQHHHHASGSGSSTATTHNNDSRKNSSSRDESSIGGGGGGATYNTLAAQQLLLRTAQLQREMHNQQERRHQQHKLQQQLSRRNVGQHQQHQQHPHPHDNVQLPRPVLVQPNVSPGQLSPSDAIRGALSPSYTESISSMATGGGDMSDGTLSPDLMLLKDAIGSPMRTQHHHQHNYHPPQRQQDHGKPWSPPIPVNYKSDNTPSRQHHTQTNVDDIRTTYSAKDDGVGSLSPNSFDSFRVDLDGSNTEQVLQVQCTTGAKSDDSGATLKAVKANDDEGEESPLQTITVQQQGEQRRRSESYSTEDASFPLGKRSSEFVRQNKQRKGSNSGGSGSGGSKSSSEGGAKTYANRRTSGPSHHHGHHTNAKRRSKSNRMKKLSLDLDDGGEDIVGTSESSKDRSNSHSVTQEGVGDHTSIGANSSSGSATTSKGSNSSNVALVQFHSTSLNNDPDTDGEDYASTASDISSSVTVIADPELGYVETSVSTSYANSYISKAPTASTTRTTGSRTTTSTFGDSVTHQSTMRPGDHSSSGNTGGATRTGSMQFGVPKRGGRAGSITNTSVASMSRPPITAPSAQYFSNDMKPHPPPPPPPSEDLETTLPHHDGCSVRPPSSSPPRHHGLTSSHPQPPAPPSSPGTQGPNNNRDKGRAEEQTSKVLHFFNLNPSFTTDASMSPGEPYIGASFDTSSAAGNSQVRIGPGFSIESAPGVSGGGNEQGGKTSNAPPEPTSLNTSQQEQQPPPPSSQERSEKAGKKDNPAEQRPTEQRPTEQRPAEQRPAPAMSPSIFFRSETDQDTTTSASSPLLSPIFSSTTSKSPNSTNGSVSTTPRRRSQMQQRQQKLSRCAFGAQSTLWERWGHFNDHNSVPNEGDAHAGPVPLFGPPPIKNTTTPRCSGEGSGTTDDSPSVSMTTSFSLKKLCKDSQEQWGSLQEESHPNGDTVLPQIPLVGSSEENPTVAGAASTSTQTMSTKSRLSLGSGFEEESSGGGGGGGDTGTDDFVADVAYHMTSISRETGGGNMAQPAVLADPLLRVLTGSQVTSIAASQTGGGGGLTSGWLADVEGCSRLACFLELVAHAMPDGEHD